MHFQFEGGVGYPFSVKLLMFYAETLILWNRFPGLKALIIAPKFQSALQQCPKCMVTTPTCTLVYGKLFFGRSWVTAALWVLNSAVTKVQLYLSGQFNDGCVLKLLLCITVLCTASAVLFSCATSSPSPRCRWTQAEMFLPITALATDGVSQILLKSVFRQDIDYSQFFSEIFPFLEGCNWPFGHVCSLARSFLKVVNGYLDFSKKRYSHFGEATGFPVAVP